MPSSAIHRLNSRRLRYRRNCGECIGWVQIEEGVQGDGRTSTIRLRHEIVARRNQNCRSGSQEGLAVEFALNDRAAIGVVDGGVDADTANWNKRQSWDQAWRRMA